MTSDAASPRMRARLRCKGLAVSCALAAAALGCSDGEPGIRVGTERLTNGRLQIAPNGTRIADAPLGTALPNAWVSADRYDSLRPGLSTLGYGVYRFPNGSLSDNYHWNGGDYYNADRVFQAAKWASSDKSFAPGFFVNTKYRGTTLAGAWGGASLLTDGDVTTFWQSDPGISTPPRFYVDLPGTSFRVVRIHWREATQPPNPSVLLSTYAPDAHHWAPQELPASSWEPVGHSEISLVVPEPPIPGVVTPRWTFRTTLILERPVTARHLRVEFSPGWRGRVGEIWVLDEAGNDLVVHDPDAAVQTRVIASPTHVAGTLADGEGATDGSFDFERFMAYLPPGAEPLICVNYGTGTPEEAAAWVEYANLIRGYGIRYWHVGNEMFGAWESGGPVSAAMYAERFLRFSAAMKAVDPSIQVIGPTYTLFDDPADSQDRESPARNWLRAFLERVGAHERLTGVKYLDGVDVHQYPYWAPPGEQNTADLLAASNLVLGRLERVRDWIFANLLAPENVSMHMSEYNAMPANDFSGSMGVHNALATANIASSLIQTFPSQAHAYFWLPGPRTPKYSGDADFDDWGEQALFAHPFSGVTSNFERAPSADYWTQYMLGKIWLGPGAVYYPVTSDRPELRAHAVRTPDSTRILILNLSTSPQTIEPFLPPGVGYLYEWSAREYLRLGTDDTARAVVNGGPSSRSVLTTKPLLLEPLSMNVVVVSSAPLQNRADILHLAIAAPTHLEPDLHVSGSVKRRGLGPISALDYRWDSGAFQPLATVDGTPNGAAETFHLVNPERPACSSLTVRATVGTTSSQMTLGPFVDASRLQAMSPPIDRFTSASTSPAWWVAEWCDGQIRSLVTAGLLYIPYSNVAPNCEPHVGRWIGGAPGSDGVRFRFATWGDSVRYSIGAGSFEQADDDGNDAVVQLRGTQGQWSTVSLAWSQFEPPGDAPLRGPLTGDLVRHLKFQVRGDPCPPGVSQCAASGAIWVDDLELIACDP